MAIEILVVDDDNDILEVVRTLLEEEGYQVKTAENGAEALKVASDHLPDLVLLDMRMPVMDGWEFTRRFRSIAGAGKVPIVVMSADQQAARKATQIAAQGSLQKPFDLDCLFAVVRQFGDGAGSRERGFR